MRLLPILLTAVALALPSIGCSQSAASQAGSGGIGDQVRAYILAHPEVVEEAIGKLQEKRQAAADTQLRQALVQNRAAMERDPRDFVAGNPQGKVTVVEFFDYRCPYCKAAAGDIEKLVSNNKDVRLVLKEFPILSPASEAAARAAIGAKAQGKYWPVHQALLAQKDLNDASIDHVLQENGVNVVKAKADGATQASSALLEANHALARTTGVTGTPAFIIGDKMVSGWVPEEIQAGIAAARKAAG